MTNWCRNNIVVTGPVEDIAYFTQTCIPLDAKGKSRFDFNSLIPMPAIVPVATSLWDLWTYRNWGTKWNASDFEVIREEPGRYECRFETAWGPPEPVYVKLAEMFPNLCFDINGLEDQFNFEFQATVRDGAFTIQYEDPRREGFLAGIDSNSMLDEAKSWGNDPKRFFCVGLCRAVTSSQCNSENEDPACEKAVVAWARGDTKEDSEHSCRDVIARNQRCIETLIEDWQFTVYAPGEIRFQEHAAAEALGVLPATNDDVPF